MSNPSISILILTFARTKYLQEALFSAINQDYDNFDIIVLNQCEQQKLFIDNNKVKIINVEKTLDTLSKGWNELIKNSNSEFITILGDDDLLMSWHLKDHIHNIINNNLDFSINPECLFWERSIEKIKAAPCLVNMVHRNRTEIRYNNEIHCGEDQWFMNFLKSNYKYKELNNCPSYIYCWANGSFHVSGNPSDPTGFYKDVTYRLNNNLEPRGKIEIIPQLREDARRILKI